MVSPVSFLLIQNRKFHWNTDMCWRLNCCPYCRSWYKQSGSQWEETKTSGHGLLNDWSTRYLIKQDSLLELSSHADAVYIINCYSLFPRIWLDLGFNYFNRICTCSQNGPSEVKFRLWAYNNCKLICSGHHTNPI